MVNTASRPAVRRLQKEDARVEQVRREVIVAMMNSHSGREYVWDLLSQSHIFATSFSPDPLEMAFNEGERNFGLRFLTDIVTYCPEQFTTMMEDANARSRLDTPVVYTDPDEPEPDAVARRHPTGTDVYGQPVSDNGRW